MTAGDNDDEDDDADEANRYDGSTTGAEIARSSSSSGNGSRPTRRKAPPAAAPAQQEDDGDGSRPTRKVRIRRTIAAMATDDDDDDDAARSKPSRTLSSSSPLSLSLPRGGKALVFSQLASMLDVIESRLFNTRSVGWTQGKQYFRLDGSVPAASRAAMAARFNSDPLVRVLITTTRVGGLGLTLTGANTVIFLDHAWNPTVDLQAMDRAHRLGQSARVDVYRLLARDTFEDRVMRLQSWKLGVSGAVVGLDNTSLEGMRDVPVLDVLLASRGGSSGSSDGGRERQGEEGRLLGDDGE